MDEDIKIVKARMEELDTQIEVLFSDQRTLGHEMGIPRKQREKIKLSLSPFWMVPDEILAIILEHACAESYLKSHCYTSLPAIAIGSVCHHWYKIVKGLPKLWSNLTVETSISRSKVWGASECSLASFSDRIVGFLEKSHQVPLNITLLAKGTQPLHWHGPLTFPGLTMLTNESHRWKMFRYIGDNSISGYDILSGLAFPLLVELDISGASVADLCRFETSPKLRTVRGFVVPTSLLPIPTIICQKITEICVDIESLETLKKVLDGCVSLYLDVWTSWNW
jgi:hypothetical protein